MAAPFARNVTCRGISVIYFSVFHDLLRLVKFSYGVLRWGSDKPMCHGGARVLYDYPRSITVISTLYYGLLCSDAVYCVLTKA